MINIKISIFKYEKYSEIASEYLVRNHGFVKINLSDSIKYICENFFDSKDINMFDKIKRSYEYIDKSVWINQVIRKIQGSPSSKIVIDDVKTLYEYYSLLNENFLPIKIVDSNAIYDEQIDLIPILKIDNNCGLEEFYQNLDLIVDNYEMLLTRRTQGGTIKQK